MKRRHEEEAKRRAAGEGEGGVRFKGLYWVQFTLCFLLQRTAYANVLITLEHTGRGRMKYVDPELRASRGGRDRYG